VAVNLTALWRYRVGFIRYRGRTASDRPV